MSLCEKHKNAYAPMCPVCMMEERDAIQAENKQMRTNVDKCTKMNRMLIKENSHWKKRYIEAVNDMAELKREGRTTSE